MRATDVPSAQNLLTQLGSLQAKLAKVPGATSITDLFNLLNGTGLEDMVLENARQSVADFLNHGITTIKTQLSGLGVTGL